MPRSRRPPSSLPRAFRPIWEALDAADRQAPSRQALATRLGVSTGTLQRILVDGEVPDLERSTNARIIRSWTRILTRLARHCGHDPRRWIEEAGITWDPRIAAICDETLRTTPGRRRRSAPPVAPEGGSFTDAGVSSPLRPTTSPWPGVVTVGIATLADGRTTTDGSTTDGGGFLAEITRRWIGAVSPKTRVRCVAMLESELVDGLRTARGEVDLGVGVVASVVREQSGIDLLPIPGWRVTLDSIAIAAGRDIGPAAPIWSEIIDPGASEFQIITDCDVIHDYLRGQCGIPEERLLHQRGASIADLARVCRRATARLPGGWLVLVTRPATCARVREALLRTPVSDDQRLEGVRGAIAEGPSHGLAVAMPSARTGWRPLLAAALDQELLVSSLRDTARLYAERLTADARRSISVAMPDARQEPRSDPVRGWRLVAFDAGDDAFARALVDRTIRSLRGAIASLLRTTGVPDELGGLDRRATDLARAHARRILPRRWLPELERWDEQRIDGPADDGPAGHGPAAGVPAVAGGVPPVTHHCHSCSVSIVDPRHRGASDHYCRFCADDEGRLRPRDDVRQLIASWMRGWQTDLDDDEALRRAERFMRAMPAWNAN